MYWMGPLLAFAGLAALLYGFWKNSRWILAGAAVTLFLAGSLGDLLDGFRAGAFAHLPVESTRDTR